MKNTPLIRVLLLVAMAAAWGPSFMFIKIAVAEIPPMTLAGFRLGLAAVLLYVILRFQGRRLPRDGRAWWHLFVTAFFHMSVPFALFSYGEQYIDSALASIINGTLPLWTVVAAHFFIPTDRITVPKAIGAGIGFVGLLFLLGPSLFGGLSGSTIGVLVIVVAVLMYAVAFILEAMWLKGKEPLVVPSAQLIAATVMLLPVALFFEQPWQLPTPSFTAIGSLLFLAIIGTAIAFVLFYALLDRAEPSYVSMSIYMVPIFGVLFGVLILDETLHWYTLVGFGLILIGVAFVNGFIKIGGSNKEALAT